MTESAQGAGDAMGCYVYGVVPESDTFTGLDDLRAVGDPEVSVTLVRHRDIAAVVSDVATDRPLGSPEDLQAHAGVLNALAAKGAPVLPFRFGTVLKDAQSVASEVLTGGHDAFVVALERMKGHAQFTLKAQYDQDAVLWEVLDERPEIRELRERLNKVSDEAAYYERIELGQLVAEAIAAKRDADSAEIHQRLAPLAAATATSEPSSEAGLVDASFLVEDRRRNTFERAAEDLARHWHGRVRLQLLGPLAPYDFVADAMGDREEEG
ncbi:GvpL/GvpF family gas vesicle protein [Streptomyces silvisoli]|uniref:GvpL/GvpF family gas vesicle protein n=1 Tax=Streptomyces silvisoli TaxID=3034235 RepID=A0ABT5ZT67_9ACTN|nr:GvpL/GvpF family gas vesicle protein [Streptomyces silvisoli]MDF3293025.1 GvpL/GvpF family gas vesicle protein [Streptomyces silvisoli]